MEETIEKQFMVDGSPLTETQTVRYTYRDDNTPQAITIETGDQGPEAGTYYYLTDGHGDIREITDKDGNTLVKYSYDAWGNQTIRSQNTEARSQELAETNPYTYASYRYDQETGMYYLRARYYDPITGRFLSKDPILKEQVSKQIADIGKSNPFVKDIADELVNDIKANHPYAYAKNNPVNYVDPDGKLVWKVVLLGVAIYLTIKFVWEQYAFWRAWYAAVNRARYIARLGGGRYTSAQRMQILVRTWEWQELRRRYPSAASGMYSAGLRGRI